MNINKFFLTWLLLAFTAVCNAQKLDIAFAVSTDDSMISNNTAKILRGKFLPALAKNEIGAVETNAIAIESEISFTNRQIVEGGMRNVHAADIQFHFTCLNLITGNVFSSLVINVNGSGVSDDETIKNAINQISANDGRIAQFISQSKENVLKYYSDNLDAVISRTQALAQTHKYDEALALLFSCPYNIPDYQRINGQIINVFKLYQTEECENIVQNARTEYANGNYKDAAEWLQQVDMTSSCASEAKQLCRAIKTAKDAEADKIISMIENAAKREADMEKLRINAVRDIATAYFNQKRSDVYFVW